VYHPDSAGQCAAGGPECLGATIDEMTRRAAPLVGSCSHDAVFALAYLRTTQTYRWARDQPGFFEDASWVNHEDAVFADYYFRAYDAVARGNLAAVPEAWQIAFTDAASHRVSGAGDLLLGMNAHINRDLPYVLASIGITRADGTSRKRDHDAVDQFLLAELPALMAELGARFDPGMTLAGTPLGLGYEAVFQVLAAWRELAWRNAEALVDAPDAAARAAAAQAIEATAAVQARIIEAATAYLPPLADTIQRDVYCAGHRQDPAPEPYPWGLPQ
jgi:hypothetical protein